MCAARTLFCGLLANRALEDNFASRLILAQALEDRLTEMASVGPVAVLHFGHQLRFHPVRAGFSFVLYRRVERLLRLLARFQSLAEILFRNSREPGAHLAAIDERAGFVIV